MIVLPSSTNVVEFQIVRCATLYATPSVVLPDSLIDFLRHLARRTLEPHIDLPVVDTQSVADVRRR